VLENGEIHCKGRSFFQGEDTILKILREAQLFAEPIVPGGCGQGGFSQRAMFQESGFNLESSFTAGAVGQVFRAGGRAFPFVPINKRDAPVRKYQEHAGGAMPAIVRAPKANAGV
jgi:hypothetical protein